MEAPLTRARPVALVGFMGAGKTTAARRLDAPDADDVLTERLGASPDEVFARDGEAAFRAAEERVVLELLGSAAPVVALGGGALGSERVRDALTGREVVWLDVDPETAWSRVAGSGRPLARDREVFLALHAEREAVYSRLATTVVLEGEDVAAALAWAAGRPVGTRLLWGRHPVLVGEYGDWWPLPGRRFTVTDANVPRGTRGTGTSVPLVLEPGERSKTLATAERIWTWLAEQGATRADHVAAVGGGVVGDLAGFAAATYQRGIPVVQVPTTLVAQVDAAIGGKTGVDLPAAKNYVGAFHQPAAVLAAPSALATLPPAELAAGAAEVVKTALIAGGWLWERVRSAERLDAPDVVAACALTKLRIVGADERDGGRRQVLNLGHTAGHAIETVTGYARYRHGEAVALGLLVALRLSGQDALREEVAGLLARHGLPTVLDPAVDLAAVATAIGRDKKRTGGAVPWVLAAGPGEVTHGHPVDPAAVRAALQELAR